MLSFTLITWEIILTLCHQIYSELSMIPPLLKQRFVNVGRVRVSDFYHLCHLFVLPVPVKVNKKSSGL